MFTILILYSSLYYQVYKKELYWIKEFNIKHI